MIKNFKWIVSDLDGTLIHHKDKENIIYHDVVVELNRVTKTRKLTIATGRHYKDVLNIVDHFKIEMPKDGFIVGSNGCQVFSWATQKLVFNQILNNSDIQIEMPKIITYLEHKKPHSFVIFAYGENEKIIFVSNNSHKFDEMVANIMKFEDVNNNIFEYLKEDIKNLKNITKFCINFLDEEEDPNEIINNLKKISDKFDYTYTGPKFIEIIVKGINKATALKYINENYYYLDPKEIILFGDSGNDIEMMQYSGTPITRDDAREEIKDKAKIIYSGGPSKFIKNALTDLIKE